MVKTIIKRDGRTAEFHPEKIADAVEKSFQACAAMQGRDTAEKIAATVVEKLESGAIEGTPTVEGVQDLVEETLIESGFVQTAKAYILYRAERSRVRDVNSRLIQTLKDITFSKAADSDMKRENANIDADTAMGTMLKYGSESAKQFYEMYILNPNLSEEETAALVEKFKTLVEQNGTLDEMEEMGKRKLAYEINYLSEGYYVLVKFTSAPEFPAELDRILGITDGVIRSLITKRPE